MSDSTDIEIKTLENLIARFERLEASDDVIEIARRQLRQLEEGRSQFLAELAEIGITVERGPHHTAVKLPDKLIGIVPADPLARELLYRIGEALYHTDHEGRPFGRPTGE